MADLRSRHARPGHARAETRCRRARPIGPSTAKSITSPLNGPRAHCRGPDREAGSFHPDRVRRRGRLPGSSRNETEKIMHGRISCLIRLHRQLQTMAPAGHQHDRHRRTSRCHRKPCRIRRRISRGEDCLDLGTSERVNRQAVLPDNAPRGEQQPGMLIAATEQDRAFLCCQMCERQDLALLLLRKCRERGRLPRWATAPAESRQQACTDIFCGQFLNPRWVSPGKPGDRLKRAMAPLLTTLCRRPSSRPRQMIGNYLHLCLTTGPIDRAADMPI